MIETRAIPWKAPRVSREGKVSLKAQSSDYQKWVTWSHQIRPLITWAWHQEGHRYDPVDDRPFNLSMIFVLRKSGKTPSDRMNLGKSLEDILQGICYPNDRQVRGGDVRRVFLGEPMLPMAWRAWEGTERLYLNLSLAF
jgi:hypothetical protein